VGVGEKGAEGRNLDLQKKEVKGNWSKLRNGNLYDMYSTQNTHYYSDDQMIERCDWQVT
jgi:hypothetical protein